MKYFSVSICPFASLHRSVHGTHIQIKMIVCIGSVPVSWFFYFSSTNSPGLFRPGFAAISICDFLHLCPSVLLGIFYPTAVSKNPTSLPFSFSLQKLSQKSNGIRSDASLEQNRP